MKPTFPGISLEADATRTRMKPTLDHLLLSQPRLG
jgi:hypothetical protein